MIETIRHLALASAVAGLAAAPLDAQEEPEAQPPEGWEVRFDRAGADATDVSFVDMPPGFHITTGPAAIFYHPEKRGSGNFRVEAEIHLFDPGDRREGYGLLFGGRDLQGADQAYTYFLLRRDGRCLIKRRDGGETVVLRDWTEQPAIVGWNERAEDAATVKNVLAVEAGEADVAFLVNGEEVARLPREELNVDGVVGVRINHSLNVHVTRVEVVPGD